MTEEIVVAGVGMIPFRKPGDHPPYFEMGAISDPITERGFRYVFRTCPRSSDFGAATVGAVQDALAPIYNVDPKTLRIAILHEDALYGQTVSGFQAGCRQRRSMRASSVHR